MGENADKKTYRYYSTERPLMPGCCPRAGVYEVRTLIQKPFAMKSDARRGDILIT